MESGAHCFNSSFEMRIGVTTSIYYHSLRLFASQLTNLDLLGWLKLEERRLQTRLTLFQKARLNLIAIPADHLAIKSRKTRQGGGGLTYHREFSKIDSYIFSFFPRTSQVWNNLPPDLKSCTNIENVIKAVSTIDRNKFCQASPIHKLIVLFYTQIFITFWQSTNQGPYYIDFKVATLT